ncbi:NUDIX hydrolase [Thalassobacillus hwangdonensis]|uniref:NUDIX hydrolase n=1 Tax=Thalassobacillus hwangdonensis TaxID=546108 RepID=A0ABW3KWU9_9BACI
MDYLYIVNVEAAIYYEGKFLIIKRSEKEEHAWGLYSLVGGKIDYDEDTSLIMKENLIREVEEEIGIRLDDQLEYIHSTAFKVEDTQVLNVVFLSLSFEGTPFIKSPDEVSEIKWLSNEEIQHSTEIPSWTKQSVQLAAKQLKLTI